MSQQDQRPQETPPSGNGRRVVTHDATLLSEAERVAIRARASPEGIVTILYTDIVQSTRIRQRLGDAVAQELFREHNRLLREQIEKHSGFEVKTYGDGFMVAFSGVAPAVACALDMQRAIARHNQEEPSRQLQIRIGLNCGETIKEEEDFFGSAVVIAARVMGLAKGGQVLASEVVRELAGEREGIRYVHYGRRRLKGFARRYDVWSVAGEERGLGGLARFWAKPSYRLAALALVLAAVAAGVAGGLVLSRTGSGSRTVQVAAPALQEIAFHTSGQATEKPVSGDCVSADLVIQGTAESEVSGDISGHETGTFEVILYKAAGCLRGLLTYSVTTTDLEGNTLSQVSRGPISFATLQIQGTQAATSVDAVTVVDGTGIYDGAVGQGSCTTLAVTDLDSYVSQIESDCRYEFTTAGALELFPEPVIVQMGASPTEATVFGGPADLPNTLAVVVLYRNTRDQPQRSLSLKLPVPAGAQIKATASGEKQPVADGERVWTLRDLEPGQLQSFEFSLLLLSADTPSIPLTVEVDGEGFMQPVRSDPVTIKVVQ